ncbi:arsenical pump-driving ATPase [Laribacter hongkongensis]|uniref:arsenical pump-driving ATPase n=1 Tax=Laribacter hongkongensis TaxID=168471 RepID=UPI001EFE967D|nr:arsenical pump-driving ATPase [Laribacter hongkongensis]MCG9065470.1 arsenical pump-driving ATPase [Laribacter hongkongensis]
MHFLDNPPAFLFFTGKGGVGKTSLACASAMRLARAGKRVLLVSTDPASNVGQVFGQAIGHQISPIAAVENLSALEIDPQAAAQQYRDRIVGPVKNVLPETVVKGIEEQLSGACTTEIAAFDEFTALLTDPALIADYDHIVFDTAPTGHTIRLLQLPGAWSGFLDANPDGASCLGPLSGLEKQRAQYHAAVDALADPTKTRLVLVARAQTSTLREVARTHEELAAIGLKQQYLVINGVFPATEAADDALAQAIVRREAHALDHQPAVLAALPQDRLPLKPFNLVGLAALEALLSDAAQLGAVSETVAPLPAGTSTLAQLVDGIAVTGHGLVMVMGKGGVGKTTIAAAVAVELARRGLPVHLTTSDPAAHLADTLSDTVPNLSISRIDPAAETARYRDEILESKGKDLDTAGRALLEEDLRSPCTEEIAVFQAFSRVIREAGRKFVVMDTAPTGHTLLLLDATGAYHRDMVRQMGDKGMHFVTPMMQLQDPARTKVLIATLAETTPVLEAAALQADLERAGIMPWAWVVNQSVAAAGSVRSPLLVQRAGNEVRELDAVLTHHARQVALLPLMAEEPVGAAALIALASSI